MEEKTTTGAEEHHHEHAYGCFFCKTAKPFFNRVWTEATENHFRNSRIEFLKGVRSFLDDRIAHLSKTDPRGTHVTVE